MRSPWPGETAPNKNDPFRFVTNVAEGVRNPKTCGIASTKIITITRNFCVPW